MTTPSTRHAGLDIARGLLLVAMLVVHVISAHGPASQVNTLHEWFGVFLISSGFVGLSGYIVGLRSNSLTAREVVRGADRGLQLVLVMFAYGVLLSLVKHVLTLGGATGECAAQHGWTPPLRFDDLGILLPIAIVQVLGAFAGARARIAVPATLALAVGSMLVPALTAGEGGLVVDILARRSLTPFYTVTSFVAIGLVGVALGRARPRWLAREIPGVAAAACGVTAVLLASPPVSSALLDQVYAAAGTVAGSLATLGYWSGVLVLLLRAFATTEPATHGFASAVAARLGRHSLFVFVLHDLLLVLDAGARDRLGTGKTVAVVLAMFIVNLAVMDLMARAAERSARMRSWIDAMLLGRSRPGSLVGGGAFSLLGGLMLAGVLAIYTSAALGRTGSVLIVDDFESARCPRWWTFGFLAYERAPAESDAHGAFILAARGPAPGSYAHGRGVFLERDVGTRARLLLLVRGEGPGSGRIKIELCEDDNGNWEIEKSPPLYVPLHDDRFVHEVSVDWRGWREVEIPLALFRDDNPGGNGSLDPARDLTSGGLLELQLLFAPSGAFGDEVRLGLDHIRFAP